MFVTGLCVGAVFGVLFGWSTNRKTKRRMYAAIESGGTQSISVTGSLVGSSIRQFSAGSSNTYDMSGNTLIINGQEYMEVLTLTVATQTEVKRLDTKYVNLQLEIKGDCHGDLCLTTGQVTVTGNCARITTSSGDVTVGGNCAGNIGTTTGDVSVAGKCEGRIETVTGDVRHG